MVMTTSSALISRSRSNALLRIRMRYPIKLSLGTLLCAAVLSGVSAFAGQIYTTTFGTTANPWVSFAISGTGGAVVDRYYSTVQGTIDTYQGTQGGSCIVFGADTRNVASTIAWDAVLSSGFIPTTNANTETNLEKLTLSFDLNLNRQMPVRVRIASVNSSDVVTGELETVVHAPKWDVWYRHSIDLARFSVVSGTFNPQAPKFRYSFQISSALGWPRGQQFNIVKVDNVSLAAPSFYVRAGSTVASPTGRSESSPFTTLAQAVTAASAGDVICVMNPINSATYTAGTQAKISKAGTPAAWIVIRSNPGHSPVLNANDWNNIEIRYPAAYIEVRDLIFRGNQAALDLAGAMEDFNRGRVYNGADYYGSGLYNCNGLTADGRVIDVPDPTPENPNRRKINPDKGVHHLRFVRNVVFDHTGGGISTIHADHVQIEDNTVYYNSFYTRYGTSGISVFRHWNWDTTSSTKYFVLRNESFGNETKVPWIDKYPSPAISDGNGIIVDDNRNAQGGASGVPYLGRTLVANNVVFGNGGAGIQTIESDRVDIFHNTAYHNSASPALNYRQVYAGYNSADVVVANNVWWAGNGNRWISARPGRRMARSPTATIWCLATGTTERPTVEWPAPQPRA